MMKYTRGTISSVFFLFYLYVLLKVILFKFGSVNLEFLWHQLHWSLNNPEYMDYGLQRANFTPFKTIEGNIAGLSDTHEQVNFIGNIAIFIPCGVFIRLWANRTWGSFLGAASLSFGLSFALECSQLVFSMGSFDVDDLILNGLGGLLGWVLLAPRKGKAFAQV
ncbi:VanZ family protein [Paenibacillus glycanilyticus]|uniref:VanZ-like domain-containing protein n=1 Tax=Paenibacillus glycanilyticus TaxID=126569 RepID=A0ABQ6GBB6_9BACL|nr:VanZ family protein [Paenibacillus glycanilyticus]GLX66558.1 hypothetical protein MU1_09020 [Paenibacillus glycanilyticus]